MKRLDEIAGTPLQWTQPRALKMEFELRSGDVVAATLRFRSMFGSFATGQSADGTWTFKRIGFWQTRVTIREDDSVHEIAVFRNKTWKGGGTLELPGGRQIRATSNLWQTRLEFQDEAGAPLIRFNGRGLVHLSAGVEIEPAGVAMPEMRWIILFGWYLTVMMQMDAAAGGAAAAAAAGA